MRFKFLLISFLAMVTFGLFTAWSGPLNHKTIRDVSFLGGDELFDDGWNTSEMYMEGKTRLEESIDPSNGTGIDPGKTAKSIEYNGTSVTAEFDDPEEDSSITYIENDIRISPRRNIYDKSQPRNLIVVAHYPDTRLKGVSYNDRPVDYDIFKFVGLKADGKNLKLPFTSKIELSQSLLDTLLLGHHDFEIQFEVGHIVIKANSSGDWKYETDAVE